MKCFNCDERAVGMVVFSAMYVLGMGFVADSVGGERSVGFCRKHRPKRWDVCNAIGEIMDSKFPAQPPVEVLEET